MRLDIEKMTSGDDFQSFNDEFEARYDAFGTLDEPFETIYDRDTEELEDLTGESDNFGENFETEDEELID
jgi:hypothetical protein